MISCIRIAKKVSIGLKRESFQLSMPSPNLAATPHSLNWLPGAMLETIKTRFSRMLILPPRLSLCPNQWWWKSPRRLRPRSQLVIMKRWPSNLRKWISIYLIRTKVPKNEIWIISWIELETAPSNKTRKFPSKAWLNQPKALNSLTRICSLPSKQTICHNLCNLEKSTPKMEAQTSFSDNQMHLPPLDQPKP